MKVAIATYDFLPNVGGVATTESILAQAFAEAGHEVAVATLTSGPVDGYPYRVLRNPGPIALSRFYGQADLIILSNLAIKLIYPLLFVRRPVALRHHSEGAFHLSKSWLSPDIVRRKVMSLATHFMTSAYIGRVSGFPAFEVTPPFANEHHLAPHEMLPPSERQGALFVGRTVEEKGVLWLLDHVDLILRTLGVSEIKILGKGELDDEIHRRIAGGLKGVRHLGAVHSDDVPREMAKARYLLTPSLWQEPFGAVALEGVAAGALPVLSNRGGLPETTGELGFFFNPDDEASLVDALERARATFEQHLASPALRQAWEASVRDHISRFKPEFSVARIIETMAPRLKAARAG